MRGKQKCRMLREIRRRIADENDIPYVTEECKYKGDCKGTCPKCESELKYLEAELERRRSLGLRVTVSALAVGMVAASAAGCTPAVSGNPTDLEGAVAYVTESEPDTETLLGEIPPVSDPSEDMPESLEGDVAYPSEDAGDPAGSGENAPDGAGN